MWGHHSELCVSAFWTHNSEWLISLFTSGNSSSLLIHSFIRCLSCGSKFEDLKVNAFLGYEVFIELPHSCIKVITSIRECVKNCLYNYSNLIGTGVSRAVTYTSNLCFHAFHYHPEWGRVTERVKWSEKYETKGCLLRHACLFPHHQL